MTWWTYSLPTLSIIICCSLLCETFVDLLHHPKGCFCSPLSIADLFFRQDHDPRAFTSFDCHSSSYRVGYCEVVYWLRLSFQFSYQFCYHFMFSIGCTLSLDSSELTVFQALIYTFSHLHFNRIKLKLVKSTCLLQLKVSCIACATRIPVEN